MWAAPLSIGFHPNFNEQLARDYNKHSADLAFDLPRWFDPLLKIENFAEPPLTSLHARRRARRIRAAACLPMHILAVHADTGLWTPEGSRVMGARVAAEGMLGNKMWPPEQFVEVLDAFLSRHPDFIAIVVGSVDLRLDRGRNGSRIVPCCGLPLDVTFALVGTSDLFLGVDSCMLHAADLYGVPGVGLFGPTNPGEFGFRFGPHVHLAGGPFMEGITVDAVLAALEVASTRSGLPPHPRWCEGQGDMNHASAAYRHPVVFFANGLGDTILALPALRALTALFPRRLTLICDEGLHHMLLSELRVRQTIATPMTRNVPD